MSLGKWSLLQRCRPTVHLQQCRNLESDRGQRAYRKALQEAKIKKSLEGADAKNFLDQQGRTFNYVEHPYTGSTVLGDKKDVTIPLPRSYSPDFVESHWYEWWEKMGFLSSDPQPKPEGKKFSMVLPPPNVTGELHLGHAFTATIQDAIVRWNKMEGNDVTWVPGTDHAGIATQVIVERQIALATGETRYDIGRAKFIEAAWKWKNSKGGKIEKQLRRMGSMLDWKKSVFTMNPDYSYAVNEAFIRLFNEGLIYRDKKLVNWCGALQTTISDIEVDSKIINKPETLKIAGYDFPVMFGMLHKFAYKLAGPTESDSEIVVATTRLETIFGDTAVAVHPNDPRYAHLIGKRLERPFNPDETIPIIADEAVDMKLGTGAVKVTPAHDFMDFEIGKRHNLPMPKIFTEQGNMDLRQVKVTNIPTKRIQGEHRLEVRQKVMMHLNHLHLFRGSNPHPMVLRLCSRSGDAIEPALQDQWFLRIKDMAEKASEAISSEQIYLNDPKMYSKHLDQWLKQAEDWCISRQLWWGHRIPVYHCSLPNSEDRWVAAHTAEEARNQAVALFPQTSRSKIDIKQDPDVLDTWFSSSLFPFAALGWPKVTEDLKRFYPLNLMETGQDLICFWVARMVMLGLKLTGQVPFEQILFHSMIRDAFGRKMSKSLGNVINPMQERLDNVKKMGLTPEENELSIRHVKKDVYKDIPKCGADSLRISFCMHNTASQSVKYSLATAAHARQTCNKIWNAFKLVHSMTNHLCKAEAEGSKKVDFEEINQHMSMYDHWVTCHFASTVLDCNKHMKNLNVHRAYTTLINFVTNKFCDVYLETCKSALSHLGTDQMYQMGKTRQEIATQVTSVRVMEAILRLLAPFAPFLSEELWQRMEKGILNQQQFVSICVAPYPTCEDLSLSFDSEAVVRADAIIDAANQVSKLVGQFQALKNQAIILMVCSDADEHTLLRGNQRILGKLAGVLNLTVCKRDEIDRYKEDSYGQLDPDRSINLILYPKNPGFVDAVKTKSESILTTVESVGKILDKLQNIQNRKPQHEKKILNLEKEIKGHEVLLQQLEKTS